MQTLLTFFSKHISVYAIFNDQSFNNTLTNDIVCFEQLGPNYYVSHVVTISDLQLNSSKTYLDLNLFDSQRTKMTLEYHGGKPNQTSSSCIFTQSKADFHFPVTK